MREGGREGVREGGGYLISEPYEAGLFIVEEHSKVRVEQLTDQ